MTRLHLSLACCALFLFVAPALAETKRDPLNNAEIDQLRAMLDQLEKQR